MQLFSWIGRQWVAYRWAFLRVYRKTVMVQTQQGLLLLSTRDNTIGRLLFCEGHFQLDLVLKTLAFLREKGYIPEKGKGTILDIGANIGVISVGMLVNGETETAVGIEPDPTNFALLQRNVAGNNLATRYTAIQRAVSDRTGNLRFALSKWNYGDHRIQSGVDTPNSENRQVIDVAASPIDEILKSLPSETVNGISLIWIDVQGHEGFVLAGGPILFARSIPVVVELWPFGIQQSGMSLETVCSHITQNYRYFWVWRRCGRYVQYPTNQLAKFCEEIGDTGEYEDIILTNT